MKREIYKYRCLCPKCGWLYQTFNPKANKRWVCKDCGSRFLKYTQIAGPPLDY